MKSSNNIDKLFADKLSNLENTPSSDAWLALEKGLQQKNKKKPIWLPYSIAAAVLVLILSGVLLHKYYPATNQGIAVKPAIQEQSKPGKETQKSNSISQQVPAVKQPTEAPQQIAQQPAIEQPAISEKHSPAPEVAIANKAVKKEVKVSEQIKSGEIEKASAPKQPEQIRTLPAIEETMAVQKKNPMLETSMALASPDASTIVVRVELDEPQVAEESEGDEEFATPAKQGKAARLLDKLRKLKKGEFDELGLSKQNLVALVKVNSNRADRQDNSRE